MLLALYHKWRSPPGPGVSVAYGGFAVAVYRDLTQCGMGHLWADPPQLAPNQTPGQFIAAVKRVWRRQADESMFHALYSETMAPNAQLEEHVHVPTADPARRIGCANPMPDTTVRRRRGGRLEWQ